LAPASGGRVLTFPLTGPSVFFSFRAFIQRIDSGQPFFAFRMGRAGGPGKNF
jgi:hypothetical protein